MPDLEQDTALRLPRVTVLKASAGSGKTFRLTQRYAQFLLSERIPRNQLRNLMAITFSNNASGEMRKNVLEWLKRLCLEDPERIREMAAVTAGGPERLPRRAGELIETILERFSEFQVRTIDSFMASVFRASALDFGFGPDFEVVLDPQPLVDYAWNLFLRDARAGSADARLLDRTIESVLDFKTSERASPGILRPLSWPRSGRWRRGLPRWTRLRSWRTRDRACGSTSSRLRAHSKRWMPW